MHFPRAQNEPIFILAKSVGSVRQRLQQSRLGDILRSSDRSVQCSYPLNWWCVCVADHMARQEPSRLRPTQPFVQMLVNEFIIFDTVGTSKHRRVSTGTDSGEFRQPFLVGLG